MSDELTVIMDIWADGGTDNLIYNGRFELKVRINSLPRMISNSLA